MTTETPMGVQGTLAAEISDALASSFSTASSATWTSKSTIETQAAAADADRLLIEVAFEGALKGAVIIDLPRSEALALVGKFIEASSEDAAEEPSQVLLQTVTVATEDLPAKAAAEHGSFSVASVQLIDELDPSIDREQGIGFELTDESGSQLSLSLYFTSALNECLTPGAPVAAESLESAAPTAPEQVEEPVKEAMNLDLVLDVELNVTLRFGQRILTLREILDLTSGSVVELDRQVEEPVELLLEGKVIARGEAVVIDGNYGLRVTEVPQPISAQLLS